MKVTPIDPDPIIAGAAAALAQSLDDAVIRARARAVKRTGKWAGSIHRTAVERDGDVLRGGVRSTLKTAPLHERGRRSRPAILPTLAREWPGRIAERMREELRGR